MSKPLSEGAPGLEARLFAPAARRNQVPILDVLSRVLPGEGLVLEVASGTGEHGVWFAHQLRPLIWQPSDPDPAMRRSIAAHGSAGPATLRPPLDLDVTAWPWPIDRAEAVVAINLIHIAPWEVSQALIAGAVRILPPGGVLFLYGPFRRDGAHTAPSNASFDASLRAQNPDWGVRDLEAVTKLASDAGFAASEPVQMPANNLSLVFTLT
jgi:SAM-dependent methyltransferase